MQRWQTENDRVRESLHLKRDADPSFNIDTVTFPKFPTTDEIIAEAEKLYSFVQKK